MDEPAASDATQEKLAIVFGDLVGTDLLTAQIGDLRTEGLRQQFFDRTRTLIKSHEGELVKIVADGFLAVFRQTEQAVEFALNLRQSLADDALGIEESRLTCRFGIHYATVAVRRTSTSIDISGWEVTYAARLLQLQQTTDLLISEAAFQSLPAPLSARFVRHREAQRSVPPEQPGVWNYRGILNEPKAAPVPADLPGHIGKYEIQSVLGEGGLGIVYLGRDPDSDRYVSIKTIKAGIPGVSEESIRQRFECEARGARLQHQNFVEVYEIGEHESIPFIATEWVQGEPLDRRMDSEQKLTLSEGLDIVSQICDGLDFAHRQQLFHRDINPANIMVQPNGRVKIVDFGIARALGSSATSLTGPIPVVGHIGYMAPERLKGGRSEGAADIFAAGVILYYLMTGHEPFAGADGMSVAHRIISEPHTPLSSYLTDYPSALDQILERALAKEPRDRYSSAEEMARDLESVAEHLKRSQAGEFPVEVRALVSKSQVTGSTRVMNLDPTRAFQIPAAGPHQAKYSTRPPSPSFPVPNDLLAAPLLAVPASPPPAVERPSPLRRLFRSLTAFRSETESTKADRQPRVPESEPSPPAEPDSGLTELLRRLETPSENPLAPASSTPPPQAGSFTQLFRALDNPQQATPQAPPSAPGPSPSPLPAKPVSPGPFAKLPNPAHLRESRILGALAPSVSEMPQAQRAGDQKLHRLRPKIPQNAPQGQSFSDPFPIECAPEAIVVIDIVQATATSDLFGWYAVGRFLIRELRQYVSDIGAKYNMGCVKSTGDGFLLTYRDEDSAEVAAVHAVQASQELLAQLALRNSKSPEQRRIAIRLALHFGEVDILPDDRLGPNISYAFRVEAVSHASLPNALNPIEPSKFPLRDYIICSEHVSEIISRRLPGWEHTSCGLFKLKGFSGWSELFLISARAEA